MIIQPKKFFSNGTFNSGNTTFSAVAPFTFTPDDLNLGLGWFQVSSTAYTDDGTTLCSVASTDRVKRLSKVGDPTKYFFQTASSSSPGYRPFYQTYQGKICLQATSNTQGLEQTTFGFVTQLPQFSMSFWVNVLGDAAIGRIYQDRALATLGPVNYLSKHSSVLGTAKWFCSTTGGTSVGIVSQNTNATIFDNTWHHIVITDDNGTAIMYVDGVLDVSFSYTRPTNTMIHGGLGAQISSSTLPAVGIIGYTGNNIVLDDKIWTAQDVANLYTYG